MGNGSGFRSAGVTLVEGGLRGAFRLGRREKFGTSFIGLLQLAGGGVATEFSAERPGRLLNTL